MFKLPKTTSPLSGDHTQATRPGRPRKDVAGPTYRRIEKDLRERIVRGALPVGTLLPGLRELSVEYGVSTPTVRLAINRLVNDGMLYVEARRGTFIASDTPATLPGRGKADKATAGSVALLEDTVLVLSPLGLDVFDAATTNPIGWDDGICRSVAGRVREVNLHLMVLNFDREYSRVNLQQRLSQLLQCHPYGVVFTQFFEDLELEPLVAEMAREHGVRLAVYGGDPAKMPYGDRVVSDHAQGAYELTRWLIQERKRRQILFLGNDEPDRFWWLQERYSGYCRAMREAGLEPLPMHSMPNGGGIGTNEEFINSVRSRAAFLIEPVLGTGNMAQAPCDAILVLSDGDCFSVAAAIRLFGKEPNRDIDVVGYDNYWHSAQERAWEESAPLATVDKDNSRLGAQLVDLLTERSKKHDQIDTPLVRLIPPVFIVNDDEVIRNQPR